MLARLCALVHNALCEEGKEKAATHFIPDYELSPAQRERKKAKRMKNKMKLQKLRRELTGDAS